MNLVKLMSEWSSNDQSDFINTILEIFEECVDDACSESQLPNQPSVVSEVCNKYRFNRQSLLSKPTNVIKMKSNQIISS